MVRRSDRIAPWLLVSGGFHRRGAMDRANMALAEHLLNAGREVHLVGHAIDPVLASRRGAHAYPVSRLGAVALGELALERAARRVMRTLGGSAPGFHVLANGGNCATGDANWVHSVHHAWPAGDRSTPLPHRMKRALERRWFRRRERRAFGTARVLIANSARTREDLLDHFQLDPARVHVIVPGADPAWRPPTPEQRREARLRLGTTEPAVVFLGALGADDNKGFGPLLDAWRSLCDDRSWSGTLLVGGTGPLLKHWRRTARLAGLERRVRFLDFVSDVGTVFAASDVLVSASRYEAYGLAIAEAFCRDVPAILPASAGVSRELAAAHGGHDGLDGLLIAEAANARNLADALRRWAADPPHWRNVAARIGGTLRRYTLDDMAAAIVRAVET